MSYIVLIVVVVAIVIIAFVAGRVGNNIKNNKNGKRVSLPKSFPKLVGMKKSKIVDLIKNIEKQKINILEIIQKETNKQRQLSGTGMHFAEDINGMTEYTIQKKLDISDRLVELCLKELEKENKIRRMKLSENTVHYVLVEQ